MRVNKIIWDRIKAHDEMSDELWTIDQLFAQCYNAVLHVDNDLRAWSEGRADRPIGMGTLNGLDDERRKAHWDPFEEAMFKQAEAINNATRVSLYSIGELEAELEHMSEVLNNLLLEEEFEIAAGVKRDMDKLYNEILKLNPNYVRRFNNDGQSGDARTPFDEE